MAVYVDVTPRINIDPMRKFARLLEEFIAATDAIFAGEDEPDGA